MGELLRVFDTLIHHASTGVLALGVGAALVVVLLLLLPRAQRRALHFPAVLFGLDLMILPFRQALDPASVGGRSAATVSLFLVLTALGRCVFLLVVDWFVDDKLGRPLPRILHDITQGLVYTGVVLITLRAAGVEPGSLFTTSALITAVVGLSLQDTLGNLFAGLSIQAQRPFEVGDWINIESDNRFGGRVVEINWRATKVITADQIEVIIPNSTLAKTPIKNFTKPTAMARRTIDVVGPNDVPPRRMEAALLRALWSIPGVLEEPAPYVLIPKFAENGIAYQLCYFVDDYDRCYRVDTVVRQRIWQVLRRERIAMPFPTQTLQLGETPAEAAEREERSRQGRRLESLRGVDFLAGVPPPLLERLAARSQSCVFEIGETVIRQGDAGHELFIIQTGQVSVMVGRTGGSTAEVARLRPGQFFGEMSLMTGERRRATVQAAEDCEMVKVDKQAFQEVLAAAPNLVEQITRVLVERQIELDENISARTARSRAETEARSHALLDKIRKFFAL
jgi:small-conductance mechanosensitive channel